MSDKYILDGHNAVPCDDLMRWAKWYETANRRVALDEKDGAVQMHEAAKLLAFKEPA